MRGGEGERQCRHFFPPPFICLFSSPFCSLSNVFSSSASAFLFLSLSLFSRRAIWTVNKRRHRLFFAFRSVIKCHHCLYYCIWALLVAQAREGEKLGLSISGRDKSAMFLPLSSACSVLRQLRTLFFCFCFCRGSPIFIFLSRKVGYRYQHVVLQHCTRVVKL